MPKGNNLPLGGVYSNDATKALQEGREVVGTKGAKRLEPENKILVAKRIDADTPEAKRAQDRRGRPVPDEIKDALKIGLASTIIGARVEGGVPAGRAETRPSRIPNDSLTTRFDYWYKGKTLDEILGDDCPAHLRENAAAAVDPLTTPAVPGELQVPTVSEEPEQIAGVEDDMTVTPQQPTPQPAPAPEEMTVTIGRVGTGHDGDGANSGPVPLDAAPDGLIQTAIEQAEQAGLKTFPEGIDIAAAVPASPPPAPVLPADSLSEEDEFQIALNPDYRPPAPDEVRNSERLSPDILTHVEQNLGYIKTPGQDMSPDDADRLAQFLNLFVTDTPVTPPAPPAPSPVPEVPAAAVDLEIDFPDTVEPDVDSGSLLWSGDGPVPADAPSAEAPNNDILNVVPGGDEPSGTGANDLITDGLTGDLPAGNAPDDEKERLAREQAAAEEAARQKLRPEDQEWVDTWKNGPERAPQGLHEGLYSALDDDHLFERKPFFAGVRETVGRGVTALQTAWQKVANKVFPAPAPEDETPRLPERMVAFFDAQRSAINAIADSDKDKKKQLRRVDESQQYVESFYLPSIESARSELANPAHRPLSWYEENPDGAYEAHDCPRVYPLRPLPITEIPAPQPVNPTPQPIEPTGSGVGVALVASALMTKTAQYLKGFPGAFMAGLRQQKQMAKECFSQDDDVRTAARTQAKEYFIDAGIGFAATTAVRAGLAMAAGSAAVPALGLLAATALTTGVVRMGLEWRKDHRAGQNYGVMEAFKKHAARGLSSTLSAAFGGALGLGASSAFNAVAEHLRAPAPAPVPVSPVASPAASVPAAAPAPVAPSAPAVSASAVPVTPEPVASAPAPAQNVSAPVSKPAVPAASSNPAAATPAAPTAQVPAAVQAPSAPQAPATPAATPAVDAPAAAEKANAARLARIEEANAITKRLNEQMVIRETVTPIEPVVEKPLPAELVKKPDPSPSRLVQLFDKLKGCMATGKIINGAPELECRIPEGKDLSVGDLLTGRLVVAPG